MAPTPWAPRADRRRRAALAETPVLAPPLPAVLTGSSAGDACVSFASRKSRTDPPSASGREGTIRTRPLATGLALTQATSTTRLPVSSVYPGVPISCSGIDASGTDGMPCRLTSGAASRPGGRCGRRWQRRQAQRTGGGAGGAWAVDAYPYLGRPLASRGAGPRGGGGRALVLVAPLPLPAPRWWPCRRGAVEKMLAGGATANTPAPAQAPAAAALTSSAGGFVRARRTLARPSELEVVLGSVASGTGSGPAAAAAAASAASATNDADSATRHWGIEMGSGPLAVDAGAIGAAWPLPAPPWLAPLLEKPPPGPADGPGRAPLVEPLSAVASAGPRVRFLPQTNGDVAGGLRWRMTPQISVGVRARLPAGFRVRVAADPSRLAEAWRGGSPLALARGLSIGVGLEVAAWDGRPPEAAASDAPAAGPSSPSRSSALGSWPAAWPALTPRGGPVTAVDSARAAGPARPPRARGGRGAPRGFSLLGRSIEWRGAPGDWRELAGRRGYWGVTVVGRAPGEADHRVAVPGSAVDGGGQRRFWDPADAASGAGGESAKKRSAGAGNAGGAREGLEWLAMSLAAALAGRGGGKGGGGGWGEGGAGAQPRSGGPTSPLDFVRGGGDGGGLFGRGGGGGGA